MRKFENPVISIAMFDAAVATGDSTRTKVETALTGEYTLTDGVITKAEWGNAGTWDYHFE